MVQTQAIVFADVDTVHLQAIEMTNPGPNEVQIRTTYSTISAGTEGWMLHGLFTWGTTSFPYVPGYQRVGTITALGPGVEGWQIGDCVAACSSQWSGPIPPFSGSHCAYANSPIGDIYALPDGVDEVDASGVVVAQVGYNAASRPLLQKGDWVLVYGDGIIGQCAAQAARAREARVILVGHRQDRLALAKMHSADVVVDARTEQVADVVLQHTHGKPVTAVLDTIQREDAQRQYLPLLEREHGQIVYSGFTPTPTWADMALLQQQELTTYFVSGWTRPRIEATLALMRTGQMRVRPLVTHLVPFTEGPQMYQMIGKKSSSFLGIVLNWEGA